MRACMCMCSCSWIFVWVTKWLCIRSKMYQAFLRSKMYCRAFVNTVFFCYSFLFNGCMNIYNTVWVLSYVLVHIKIIAKTYIKWLLEYLGWKKTTVWLLVSVCLAMLSTLTISTFVASKITMPLALPLLERFK